MGKSTHCPFTLPAIPDGVGVPGALPRVPLRSPDSPSFSGTPPSTSPIMRMLGSGMPPKRAPTPGTTGPHRRAVTCLCKASLRVNVLLQYGHEWVFSFVCTEDDVSIRKKAIPKIHLFTIQVPIPIHFPSESLVANVTCKGLFPIGVMCLHVRLQVEMPSKHA